jgi:hypothetical protein
VIHFWGHLLVRSAEHDDDNDYDNNDEFNDDDGQEEAQ